jgi:hypothetical protein
MIAKGGNRLVAEIRHNGRHEPDGARLDQTPESVKMTMETCLAE